MSSVIVAGNTSGSITLQAPDVAGTTVLTLPTTTGTLVVNSGAQTIEFADGSASAPSITNSGNTNTGIFFPAADTIAFAEGGVEVMRIDSAGNVGIGVTPSAWRSTQPTIQVGTASFGAYNNILANFAQNMYADSSNVERYITSTWATQYYQYLGAHAWRTAPIGTAGNAITFTQAMTLDASGNLGIGTASPAVRLEPSSTTAAVYTRNSWIASNTDNGEVERGGFEISTRNISGSTRTFGVYGYTTDLSTTFRGGLTFKTVNGTVSESMRITPLGEVLVGTTSAVSGGANLQVSDGITFPATAVASANANTLDDYEEGSFTPVLAGTTLAGTGVYTTQTGTYTKIGRLVYAKIALTWTAHTGTGNMNITGLPFTPASGGIGRSAGSMAISNITYGGTHLFAEIGDSSTNVVPTQTTTGATSSRIPMDVTGTIIISISYETT
jgi:hypothetical protein